MNIVRMSGLGAVLVAVALTVLSVPAAAGTYSLTIEKKTVNFTGRDREAMTINGQVPGPTLRFKEGEDVTIHVTNKLDVDSSIHWHGFILPYQMDGVPGISFPGIKPGETFTYRFKVRQSGTYWYHSHSGMQEQQGMYGPVIIEPVKREPYRYDRDYVVMLSDWSDQSPHAILSNLKKKSDYYQYGQRTLGAFLDDAAEKGFGAALRDRLEWGEMRMAPTDIADVAGYAFLTNGRTAAQNWTGLFRPGERVRLRFINGSAMSYFDVRIPGLKMTVVQADGNDVLPMPVDEFRIAVAETYDVIVQPKEDRAYTIFAQSMDRAGAARGTLAPREGMVVEVPPLSPRPQLTMADMGASHGDMDHAGHGAAPGGGAGADPHAGHVMGPMSEYVPGSGLAPVRKAGEKFLVYGDLRAMRPYAGYRKPDREIELKLTGNMERYFWSINGKKYSEAEPIRLKYGERVRFKFVNTTMMAHPMHLHGMWMQLDNGTGRFSPLKHVVNVAPGMTLNVDVPVDAEGEWAFHCHLMYHMATGMFRKIIVEKQSAAANQGAGR
ncbi:MAG: copper resistance system multicopper oxidase [Alphaproteobacteria bacterium]|nr:copper resistance system multicopper oxidase [Alphaproteobacteria bacterium]